MDKYHKVYEAKKYALLIKCGHLYVIKDSRNPKIWGTYSTLKSAVTAFPKIASEINSIT